MLQAQSETKSLQVFGPSASAHLASSVIISISSVGAISAQTFANVRGLSLLAVTQGQSN